jgi:hypothetical protein
MPEVLRGIRAIAQIRGYHLKFAHVGNNVPGDIGATSEGGRRSLWVLVRGTLLQDGDREVGSQNVGAEAHSKRLRRRSSSPGISCGILPEVRTIWCCAACSESKV